MIPGHHLATHLRIHHQLSPSCSLWLLLHAIDSISKIITWSIWRKKSITAFHLNVSFQIEGSKYFTLNRGAGFSPLIESTIQFSEPPEVQLLRSVPLDEEWKFRSSASLLAAATPSPYHTRIPWISSCDPMRHEIGYIKSLHWNY